VSKLESADSERLSVLLGEELKLYKQIRKLTEKQAGLLARDDIEEFDSSLDKREKLIEQIKGLHQEKEPLMQSRSSVSTDNNFEIIEQLNAQIRSEIEICSKLNDENIILMKEKTKEQTVKIDKQSAKRKGIGGYAQSVPNTPEMFDKKT